MTVLCTFLHNKLTLIVLSMLVMLSTVVVGIGPWSNHVAARTDALVVTEIGNTSTPDAIGTCDAEATFIHQIQGSGATFDTDFGGVQTVEAVVTGDFPGLEGFYIQEELDDTDTLTVTSEGIFVFLGDDYGTQPITVGQRVRVEGTVGEFETSDGASSQTQLAGAVEILDCGEADTPITPLDLELPVAALDVYEAYEGMLLRFPQDLMIVEYFNFDRFGEIVLSSGDRPFQPTNVVMPGDDAIALQEANTLRRITLDDGRSSSNPDPSRHPNGEPFTLENRFRGGDRVANVVGVLGDTFGRYRIQPTAEADYTAVNERTAAPDDVGGTLKVASFNVLNYFTTLDDGNEICGPNGDLECRGADADQPDEFERQRTKVISALVSINADIVGLVEIENNTITATQDLVTGLNTAIGKETYSFIDTGTIGTDAIKVALIYKTDTVSPTGDFAILDSSVDDRFIDTKNRPVLAQTFVEEATDEQVTVAVGHLKSKGSDCDDIGDPDTGDGQGNCNQTRTIATQAMVDWLTDKSIEGEPNNVLIIGDLNAYAMEDPIRTLTAAGYTNLIAQFGGAAAYSYVFDGQFGYLDHALSSEDLTPKVTGATEWHINADEPDIFDYDTSFKKDAQDLLYETKAYRSSDHDPVIVGLDLTAPTTSSLYLPLVIR
ncbi:MAG: ExeM/NucH family extracellular endonuclease [Chloroflexi bacterium AL-N1]|nr:ExeM/NucH family extracellular endonuclease [Chloroflexi bacterium AL-N1]NOK92187.1 ExeM/NucH family extracellular endonuclease [Chloroflexi bacterium AL-N15]